MTEKPEADDFDDDAELGNIEADDGTYEFSLEELRPKKGTAPQGEPAWRKLEKIREQKYTAEQLSDFDDYDIGDGEGGGKKKRKRLTDL
jgi:hypothetical protein